MSDRRLDWLVAGTSAWLVGGAWVDAWYHHRTELESFFTPAHALLYAGFGAAAAVLLLASSRVEEGRFRLRPPVGYRAAVIGVPLFLAGGVGDSIWHTIFGIEQDVDALLSPTHLVLGLGAAAISLALESYGAPGYEIRAYGTRADALRDAAVAVTETGAPVVLLTWRGAHTWVMTGYRADADPTLFADANVTGTYILDPWYPRVSSIWGPSDPPGTFQDAAEMERNFLPWKRAEGRYPDRDGMFIALVPTGIVPTP